RALGASEARVFRQLLAQSALVGLLGAAVALVAATPLVKGLLWLAPPNVPPMESIPGGAPVPLATVSAPPRAPLVFGAAAAARGRSGAARSLLHTADAGARVSRAVGGGGLVAVEIAVALALGVMASLMARSFAGLRAVDLGFQAEGVVAARVARTTSGDDSPERTRAFFDTLLARVRALP